MPAWATVLLTLGSTAIGATAALIASWMQLRSARRDRERAEAAARRARGGTVLGPILGVLDDLEPQAIASSDGRSEQTIANIAGAGGALGTSSSSSARPIRPATSPAPRTRLPTRSPRRGRASSC
jgi:hypothetical protein